MSIPRDHHYLPRFYLKRWAVDGKVYRYDRKGYQGAFRADWKAVKSVAYERDLYRLRDINDLADSQYLEMAFFQRIDDNAAAAFQKLDQRLHGSQADRVALAQFMVSLLHRSPSRLADIRQELAERTDGAPYEHMEGDEFKLSVEATANRLLATLVENADASSIVGKFGIHKIDVSSSNARLLTSDRPITLSAHLISPDAFMILPIGPNSLLVLTHLPAIANAFSSQNPTVLVKGINQAVVEQSVDVVIACDASATKMVDRLLHRPQLGRELDSIGLIRRKSPYVDLSPRVRVFSRHDKARLRYLGS
jgi:hypothetical protein